MVNDSVNVCDWSLFSAFSERDFSLLRDFSRFHISKQSEILAFNTLRFWRVSYDCQVLEGTGSSVHESFRSSLRFIPLARCLLTPY